MTDRELMQMALQDIQNSIGITKEEWKPRASIMVQLLRDRLAQPEPVHASDISQERVDETAKRKHEFFCPRCGHCCQQREWVGLTDLTYRLRKRAEIRRQIPDRKSVQEGKPDRIVDLLEEAADALDKQWVGITDLELESIAESCDLWGSDVYAQVIELAATIEKRLKERNT
jgi:hypothetical protein